MDYVFQFGAVWKDVDLLLLGAWLTVKLSFLTLAIGLVVGTAGALARISRHRLLRGVARTYVEAIRNTPFLIQLLLLYLGLPADRDQPRARAGRPARDGGQFRRLRDRDHPGGHRGDPEGTARGRPIARASPCRRSSVTDRHEAGAADRYPALSSQFILLVLTSSVVSVISAEELTAVADRIASRNFRTFEVYFIVTLMYLAFSIVLRARLARAAEAAVPLAGANMIREFTVDELVFLLLAARWTLAALAHRAARRRLGRIVRRARARLASARPGAPPRRSTSACSRARRC